MTTTVNLLFGSMIYDSKTGIILNDEMDDFALPNVSNAFNLTPLFSILFTQETTIEFYCTNIIINDATNSTDFVIEPQEAVELPVPYYKRLSGHITANTIYYRQ